MDKKPNENQDVKYHAAGCSETCSKCNSACSLSAEHNGPHKCESGHNW